VQQRQVRVQTSPGGGAGGGQIRRERHHGARRVQGSTLRLHGNPGRHEALVHGPALHRRGRGDRRAVALPALITVGDDQCQRIAPTTGGLAKGCFEGIGEERRRGLSNHDVAARYRRAGTRCGTMERAALGAAIHGLGGHAEKGSAGEGTGPIELHFQGPLRRAEQGHARPDIRIEHEIFRQAGDEYPRTQLLGAIADRDA